MGYTLRCLINPGVPPRLFSDGETRHLLAREIQRCTRYQDFLSLCLINVSYPGPARADADAAVTRRIAEMLRSTDMVGLIGSEIAVLLVHTPDSEAAMISDRIRARIQGDTFEMVPAPGRVTLSIGLASFPTHSTSENGLLAHAQAQLEAA